MFYNKEIKLLKRWSFFSQKYIFIKYSRLKKIIHVPNLQLALSIQQLIKALSNLQNKCTHNFPFLTTALRMSFNFLYLIFIAMLQRSVGDQHHGPMKHIADLSRNANTHVVTLVSPVITMFEYSPIPSDYNMFECIHSTFQFIIFLFFNQFLFITP